MWGGHHGGERSIPPHVVNGQVKCIIRSAEIWGDLRDILTANLLVIFGALFSHHSTGLVFWYLACRRYEMVIGFNRFSVHALLLVW